jgi:hypothetical protein
MPFSPPHGNHTKQRSTVAAAVEVLAGEPPRGALEAWGVPPVESGALRDEWMQRTVAVRGYRELAGITDPAVAIGPAPARQAGMSEAFAASVRALELPDEIALIEAMVRGELEARVREYVRAEAIAPADVQAEVGSIDEVWKHFDAQARTSVLAGNEELARSAEDISRALETDRERLQVADAARREWAEATAATAEAAEQARAELDQRGPARWDEARPEARAETGHEVQAPTSRPSCDPRLRLWSRSTKARSTRPGPRPTAAPGRGPEAQATMEADVDPGALTVMAKVDADLAAIDEGTFDDNLARAGGRGMAG